MAVRDAVVGDLDAIDAVATSMAVSAWRCDTAAPPRPSRAQIAGWIGGANGRHVFVNTAISDGSVNAAMVHDGPLGKWWINDLSVGFLLRLVALCTAVWNLTGDCYGHVRNPTAAAQLSGEGRFTFEPPDIVRFHP